MQRGGKVLYFKQRVHRHVFGQEDGDRAVAVVDILIGFALDGDFLRFPFLSVFRVEDGGHRFFSRFFRFDLPILIIVARGLSHFERKGGEIEIFLFFVVRRNAFAVFRYTANKRRIHRRAGLSVETELILSDVYFVFQQRQVAVYPNVIVGHGRLGVRAVEEHSLPTAEGVPFFGSVHRRFKQTEFVSVIDLVDGHARHVPVAIAHGRNEIILFSVHDLDVFVVQNDVTRQ